MRLRTLTIDPIAPTLAIIAIVAACTGHLVAAIILLACTQLFKLKFTVRR